MSCPVRKYPLRTPENHRVPIPRWTLSLPESISKAYVSYIGIQIHSDNECALKAKDVVIGIVQDWLSRSDGPAAFESFILIEGNDNQDTVVWVCYWSDQAQQASSLERLSLTSIHLHLSAEAHESVGLWQESFETEVSRLETNYSGLDYLPGLARLPESKAVEHRLSAYWGAARDRIPDSAHDLFPPAAEIKRPTQVPRSLGQRLIGSNHENLVHIRSGQFWTNCGQQEADAYEKKLEPTLRKGLEYLRGNPLDTGAMGIRYLRNETLPMVSDRGYEMKETCGAGFFTNLEDLERWAHTHQSHLKIYRGALSHYKEFGEYRKFRTWHEVCLIREGKAMFEYINCTPQTGVIAHLCLTQQPLSTSDDF